ncbi:MAG: GNAT family N-acetyltransferase [Burkholderiales bacterium]|jgi:GNAT superfamily N-acetyltransferase
MGHELEHIEWRMYQDMHAAADAQLRSRLKLNGAVVGSAFASVAGALPASAIAINVCFGLGLEKQATRGDVDQIIGLYTQAGVQRYFIQLHPQARPQSLDNWLIDHALEPTRGWMMFQRGREAPAPAITTSLKVREATTSDAQAFARISCDAFDLGEAAIDWLVRLVGRPGWHIFMSFDEDEPAGTGAVFVEDDLAYFTFGATAPAYRGRGGQSALLRARVAAALDLGCRTMATCTGEEVPGDAQHSYKNIMKTGFRECYVRRNFALPKA